MFNINNWKEPILKNDIKFVLLNGILFSLLGGILGGSLDFLFSYINVRLTFSLIILTLFIGYRVSRSYSSFHILYPTLTIPFMIFGMFISHFTYLVILYGIQNIGFVLTSSNLYLGFLLSPVSELIYGIQANIAYDIVLGIVNIIIHIIAFVSCYLLAKRYRSS